MSRSSLASPSWRRAASAGRRDDEARPCRSDAAAKVLATSARPRGQGRGLAASRNASVARIRSGGAGRHLHAGGGEAAQPALRRWHRPGSGCCRHRRSPRGKAMSVRRALQVEMPRILLRQLFQRRLEIAVRLASSAEPGCRNAAGSRIQAEAVAVFLRAQGIERRQEHPALTSARSMHAILLQAAQDAQHQRARSVIAARQMRRCDPRHRAAWKSGRAGWRHAAQFPAFPPAPRGRHSSKPRATK